MKKKKNKTLIEFKIRFVLYSECSEGIIILEMHSYNRK
jgi:hypothetical protein